MPIIAIWLFGGFLLLVLFLAVRLAIRVVPVLVAASVVIVTIGVFVDWPLSSSDSFGRQGRVLCPCRTASARGSPYLSARPDPWNRTPEPLPLGPRAACPGGCRCTQARTRGARRDRDPHRRSRSEAQDGASSPQSPWCVPPLRRTHGKRGDRLPAPRTIKRQPSTGYAAGSPGSTAPPNARLRPVPSSAA